MGKLRQFLSELSAHARQWRGIIASHFVSCVFPQNIEFDISCELSPLLRRQFA